MHDLALALRALSKRWSYTAAVALTLALGIGASTAVFSVADTLLFRPLPLPHAERLVVPISHTNNGQYFLCAFAEIEAWRASSRCFSSIGAASALPVTLSGPETTEMLRGARADSAYFTTLGIRPALGRLFEPADETGATSVAVVGFETWQRRFGGRADAIGQALVLNEKPYILVGVAPAGIDLPSHTEIYIPLERAAIGAETTRYSHQLWTVARLKDGATVNEADLELKTISAHLAQDQPAQQRNWTALALPLRNHLFEDNERMLTRKLSLLGGAVVLLVLIACANAANLVLLRSLNQERELAIRIALGANRWDIFHQLLVESVALAIVGGLLGLALATALTPAIFALSPAKAFALVSTVEQPGLDWRVLGFVGVMILITAPLFSLPAAWRALRLDPWRSIQQGSGSRSATGSRSREIILVVAIGLSLALLTSAGALAKSLAHVQQEPLGFQPDNVITLRLGLPGARYDTLEKRLNLLDPLIEQVRALPGVQQAGFSNRIPLHSEGLSESCSAETGPLSMPDGALLANFRLVSTGYLEALGATLSRGRLFEARDRSTAPAVAIVNVTFSNLAWPGEDPIGKRIRFYRKPGEWCTVVGVIADLKENYIGGLRATQPAWYLAYPQQNRRSPVFIAARATGDLASTAKAIETSVHHLDPSQPIYEVMRMSDHVQHATQSERFGPMLIGTFSVAGLLLVAIGVYGIAACLVETRTKELAVRLALGASPASLRTMVIRRSFVSYSMGACLGLLLSVGLLHIFSGLLFHVSAFDPVVFGVPLLVLALITLAATWIPAHAATRTDPNIILRAE